MKNLVYLLLLALCFACPNDAEVDTKTPPPAEVATPAPKTVTIKAGQNSVGGTGVTRADQSQPSSPGNEGTDLNGDGEADRLEVVTTKEDNDGLGFKRQLVVYSGAGADLDAWYTAEDVVLSTKHGGMMGDPLEDVSIENGTIVVRHFGGSRQKWHYVHRFRWQNNDFQLIGATIDSNDPCTEYTQLDYNLSTGNADYSTTPQDCETGKEGDTAILSFRQKQPPLSMNGFTTGEHRLQGPGMETAVYY
jgi:hypothetical protein